MGETDAAFIRERLEEGRNKLGGFGEPVWSQALMSLDRIQDEMKRLRDARDRETRALDREANALNREAETTTRLQSQLEKARFKDEGWRAQYDSMTKRLVKAEDERNTATDQLEKAQGLADARGAILQGHEAAVTRMEAELRSLRDQLEKAKAALRAAFTNQPGWADLARNILADLESG